MEFRTAAIYHASNTALGQVDNIQNSFIRSLGLTTEESLLVFGLAPLATRRDIAMLGIIHRSILDQGPAHFRQYFQRAGPSSHPSGSIAQRRHSKQLQSFRDGSRNLVSFTNSIFGLVDVYNLLPGWIIEMGTTKNFQTCLQHLLKHNASMGYPFWQTLFSGREPLWRHPLLRCVAPPDMPELSM